MKTTRETLAQFLAKLGLTEQQLKRSTGIPIYRLRAIYKDGQFTDDELIQLIKVLTARPAVELVYAAQIGNFNQNGIGNTQTIVNNFLTIVMRRLAAIPGAVRPRVLPSKPALVGSVQQQALGRLPGGQAGLVSGEIALAGRVR